MYDMLVNKIFDFVPQQLVIYIASCNDDKKVKVKIPGTGFIDR